MKILNLKNDPQVHEEHFKRSRSQHLQFDTYLRLHGLLPSVSSRDFHFHELLNLAHFQLGSRFSNAVHLFLWNPNGSGQLLAVPGSDNPAQFLKQGAALLLMMWPEELFQRLFQSDTLASNPIRQFVLVVLVDANIADHFLAQNQRQLSGSGTRRIGETRLRCEYDPAEPIYLFLQMWDHQKQ